MPTEINETVLLEWHMTYGGHDRVQHMLHHLDDADRVEIDVFLIQSLIYEEIETNNNKGMSVPASTGGILHSQMSIQTGGGSRAVDDTETGG